MLFQSLILFLITFLGGMAVLFIHKPSPTSLKRLLIFVGGYLFAITFLHILPELFSLHTDSRLAGLYILIGFFLQLLLEFFSKGVEHGHMYESNQDEHRHSITPSSLMVALFIHAFLDGVILNNSSIHSHHNHSTNSLLIGILLHKVPEAFALASILNNLINRKRTVILYLSIFALATPLGLLGSGYGSQQQWLSEHVSLALWGIVSGNFVHIATTIFLEANPNHQPNVQKFLASLTGVVFAAICEFLL